MTPPGPIDRVFDAIVPRAVDAGLVSIAYGLTAALVVYMAGLFGFFYYWIGLSITGRSIGKSLIGRRVVAVDGHPISPGRAAVRTIVYPVSFILGRGLIPIVLGKQRRALHDLLAGDKVLYDWGDRPAEMPAPLTDWVRCRTGAEAVLISTDEIPAAVPAAALAP
jgi:uncharacterized RDD family membrane protein YckC